ncbi:hypothetical protein ANANG_G00272720 [Anguilla anguilla]|uniref:UPF3 domain-containing protein n=1 Tax=Anguilla anguilla TaxID=7936 RepID=A0A9D3RK01_ANGAN|nr:hypothetical protein ANANG_G00272720 [Anguilla anguilla]
MRAEKEFMTESGERKNVDIHFRDLPRDQDSVTTNSKPKEEKKEVFTKVVLRRLPPSLSKDQLEEQISPLPAFDYFEFFSADQSLYPHLFSRAYINFKNPEDIVLFRDRFDGYVFIDNKGQEYPAIVEFAPFQKVSKKKLKKKDTKAGSIEEAKRTTPLLEYIKNKKLEKQGLTFPRCTAAENPGGETGGEEAQGAGEEATERGGEEEAQGGGETKGKEAEKQKKLAEKEIKFKLLKKCDRDEDGDSDRLKDRADGGESDRSKLDKPSGHLKTKHLDKEAKDKGQAESDREQREQGRRPREKEAGGERHRGRARRGGATGTTTSWTSSRAARRRPSGAKGTARTGPRRTGTRTTATGTAPARATRRARTGARTRAAGRSASATRTVPRCSCTSRGCAAAPARGRGAPAPTASAPPLSGGGTQVRDRHGNRLGEERDE